MISNFPNVSKVRLGLLVAVLATMAGCAATPPSPVIQRSSPEEAAMQTRPIVQEERLGGVTEAPSEEVDPLRMSRPGTGQLINRSAASQPPPGLGARGDATFNFEGDSLHAVIKVILGDLLEQNYVIAPGVQGTVTVSTPRPVNPQQALSLLENVLAWNNARMIWSDGRYNIVPADQAVAGQVAPRTGTAASARGYEVRAVPLQFISAAEMEKLLGPYARTDSILSVDPSRNMITIGGTSAELANYMRTIEIFDVDWLEGMSVGVFRLQSSNAEDLVQQLEGVFGAESETPVAGMYRFMPLTGVNAVMVITPQPKYLRDIEQWIQRIDTGGQAAGIYVYEVKHSKAVELAEQLSAAFGATNRSVFSQTDRMSLAPGLDASERGTGLGGGQQSRAQQRRQGQQQGALGGGFGGGNDNGVTITAIEENNALIVRATAGEWESIRRAIDRLDVMPLQVHIEAQIIEVKLSGNLRYGVSWFFNNSIEDPGLRAEARTMTGTQPIGGTIGPEGMSWLALRPSSLAVVDLLDSVSDVRVLSAPSLMVRNNAEAELQAGRQIPVASTIISPITGGGTDTANTVVQFRQTGVNLRVRPRVSTNGMVFMEIVQEVSTPAAGAPTVGGNPSVDRRNLSTEVAVQSGETIMLAGLINDESITGSSGVPGLSRLPVIGALFGQQHQANDREEIVILITPTVIRDPSEARRLTDEYGRRFRALDPMRTEGSLHGGGER